MDEFEVVQHPQIDGLRLFFDAVDDRTAHVHEEFELIWIVEGTLEIRGDQLCCEALPGDIVLFHPGQTHEFHKVDGSCTFLCVQVTPGLLERAFPAIRSIRFECARPGEFLDGAGLAALKDRLLSMTRRYLDRPEGYELFCVGQCHLLFGELIAAMPHRRISREELEEQERRSARLRRLLRYVDENYMHKILLSDFARQEGRSVSYLSHFISQTLQQSFQEYVNSVRFHNACRLIAAGRRRMLDVCVECGFSDYRYFSRTFRERVGMTPEAYSRQSLRPAQEETRVPHSLYSMERFYTRQESIDLLERLEQNKT